MEKRIAIKTYTVDVNREIDDGLALSREALQQLQVAMMDAFKKAFTEAVEVDRLLPSRCVATIKFALEGLIIES